MDTRKPIDSQAAALMTLLCAIWGLQQVAIKAAAPDIAPVLQVALRSGIASVLVALLLIMRRDTLNRSVSTWRAGLAVGVLYTLEFVAVAEGLRFTSAAHMVIFLYTAPIFAALGLHFRFPSERLTALQWTGILIAFCGVVLAFQSPAPPGVSASEQRLGDALGLAGAVFWGATTLTIRCSNLSNAPAPLALLYQLAAAFVILILVAWLSGQTQVHVSTVAVASLTFQTLAVSLFSFLTWLWLLRRYLASRLGVLSFMTPLFGVAFGVGLLDEQLELSFILGALLVLAGIVMVSGRDLLQRNAARRAMSTPNP
ncbi:DMT family transporter [Pseudomonas sp. v388]|uniref:DMT family transporter n=1 Tax=Pseudomonas sp. v388 TaxID=2479849 RepID=UPI000F7702E3|nr:DMT family transporter [Pseudomonas sp. v388]RRV10303.1 DMT family transporter [Pseudomonas sp. v388]